jgi:hypothetical protein
MDKKDKLVLLFVRLSKSIPAGVLITGDMLA